MIPNGRWMGALALGGMALLLGACGSGGDGLPGDINGTGADSKVFVRGPITGLGSVIINGKRFDTAGAVVESDRQPASVSALRVGQVVSVEGTRDDSGNLRASRIRYDADLVGPVSAIDPAARTLTVLGQTVLVVGRTVFDDVRFETLAVGDVVEISGARDGEGAFTASYIEREDDDDVEVAGVIRELDTGARRFRIGQLTVDYAGVGSGDLQHVAEGAVVEVEGRMQGGVLVAQEIEREDDSRSGFVETGAELEISGTVAGPVAGGRFVLRGFTVAFDGATRFEDGVSADLVEGARVTVEGRVDAAGLLRAEEIDFEHDDDRAEAVEIGARVQSVSGSRLGVLGIVIDTDAATRIRDEKDRSGSAFGLQDLVVGDYVEIAARRRDGAPLLASRVEREDDEDEADELQGFVDRFDRLARTLVVSGVSVDAATAAFDDLPGADAFWSRLAAGDRLEVEGRFDGSVLRADRIEFDNHDDDDDDQEDDQEDDDD